MSSGLMALLDDVAAIAKLAAASVDDAAALAAKASVKAAGVVIDDAAITPGYVVGFDARRELPIVGKIALGSLRNKLLVLLPATLALSYFLPWTITPLLILGGAYLCYEGAEKVLEAILPHHADAPDSTSTSTPLSMSELENDRVTGAIRTDFILSAEIMALTLATVSTESILMQAVVLAFVGVAITVAVYGLVALIVRADDAGVALVANNDGSTVGRLLGAVGRFLVVGMPGFLASLGVVGTAALLWVGGGVIVHGLDAYEIHFLGQAIDSIAASIAELLPFATGLMKWLVTASLSGLVGLGIGATSILVIRQVGQIFREAKIHTKLR